jgi:exopolysaccharide production protein ExoY
LPQLINILRGDMSCIGPRPVLARELACHYGASAKAYMSARPGLSGMWQVSGRSTTSYRRRIACDRLYVSRWSMLLDLKILYRTIPTVLKTDQTS